MNLIRWEPFGEMVSLRQAMDRIFEDSFVRPSRVISAFGETAGMPVDMYQTPAEVVVKVTLPGVKPEDVDITITGDTLTIKGESKEEQETKREDYLYKERRYGTFTRSLTLPAGLKPDKATAGFDDGVLTLTIPKAEEAKPKTIKITPQSTIEDQKSADEKTNET